MRVERFLQIDKMYRCKEAAVSGSPAHGCLFDCWRPLDRLLDVLTVNADVDRFQIVAGGDLQRCGATPIRAKTNSKDCARCCDSLSLANDD